MATLFDISLSFIKATLQSSPATLSSTHVLYVALPLVLWPWSKDNDVVPTSSLALPTFSLSTLSNPNVYLCLKWVFISGVFGLLCDFAFSHYWERWNDLSQSKKSYLLGTMTELPNKIYLTFAFFGKRCLIPGAKMPYNPNLILYWQMKASLLAWELITQYKWLEWRMKAHHIVFMIFTYFATFTPLQKTQIFQECLQIEGWYGFGIFGIFICALNLFHADKCDSPGKFRYGQFLTYGMGTFKTIEWILLLRCIGVFLWEKVSMIRLSIVGSMLFFCYLHYFWFRAFERKLEKYRFHALGSTKK